MEPLCKRSAKGMQLTPSPSSCAIAKLPTHILMEILCRVPAKTLMASKCVCKLWLRLLKDPQFSQLQQSRAPTQICFQLKFNCHRSEDLRLRVGNLHFLNNDFKFNTLPGFPKFSVRPNNVVNYQVTSGEFVFANACNGLLCYYGMSNKFAVIWNPTSGEFITLPASRIHKGLSTCRAYGLGFSKKSNRYKLLRVVARKETESCAEVVVAEICTVEKGCSWKAVGPCPYTAWLPFGAFLTKYSVIVYDRDPLYGIFLQGSLHWVGADSSESDVAIVIFDFEDDRFGMLPLPPFFTGTAKNMDPPVFTKTAKNIDLLNQERLGVLEGCLFVTDYTSKGVSVWLMKEYGVQDSWTKIISLQFTFDHGNGYYEGSLRCLPRYYMDNGELLMTSTCYDNTHVIVYNPVLQSARAIGYSYDLSLRVIAYRPTHVLLKESMMGYDVHVTPRRADLNHGEMSVTPNWWEPVEEEPSQQHGFEGSSVGLAREKGSETMVEVLDELRKERQQRQELEEQTEQLKQQNQQLVARLQNEQAKVKQLEQQIQQSGELKQHNG